MSKFAVDFGTTNTVVATWREANKLAETIGLAGLALFGQPDQPALIPSLVYVANAPAHEFVVGYPVKLNGLDARGDQRYFAGFKRGLTLNVRPMPRRIDGEDWDEQRISTLFLRSVLLAIMAQEQGPIEELVLTVPVQSFELYLKWLRSIMLDDNDVRKRTIRRVRIVDESTAAALGYQIRRPGELILVIDFGGGTLDVSLVRMPIGAEGEGTILSANLEDDPAHGVGGAARVIAKAGRLLGGEDIDHWIIEEFLMQNGMRHDGISSAYGQLKVEAENAKIRLSSHDMAEVNLFNADNRETYRFRLSRLQFEELLERNGFYAAIQKTLDKTLRAARTKGIFPEDIGSVLVIGGTSLIPSVGRLLRGMFGSDRVFADKPFEAVAHGALALANGLGLDDFLYHSYGVRHLSPLTGRHEWEEIIAAGTRYPLETPVRLVLSASRDGQDALELVIGEVEESTGGATEVMFGDRAILMVEGGIELRRVLPLNADESRLVARLMPPGKAGDDRVEVLFNVDKNRTLRVTVSDILTACTLLHDVPVVELR